VNSSHGLDPNLSRNAEASGVTEAAAVHSSAQNDHDNSVDAGVIESDDGDSSWTDVSSHGDVSSSSAQEYSASDSDGSSKRVGGKKLSQNNRLASNVHNCSGEKLVRIVFLSFIRFFVIARKCLHVIQLLKFER